MLDESILVHTYDTKNFEVIDSDVKEFEKEENDSLSLASLEYINNKQEEHTRSYIVTTINASGQGIIPTCSATKFKEYNVDRKYIYNICIDQHFTNFVSKIEIKWIQKFFAKTGIDLIFSPFVILKKLSFENLTESKVSMHILYTSQNSTLLISKDGEYLFGGFFSTVEDTNPLYSDFSKDQESEDEFEIEDEEDFEIDEEDFSLEEDAQNDELDYKQELDLIETNKLFAQNLNKTLKEFYKNPLYEGSFVDTVVIYSEEKVDESVVEYIENELFIDVQVKKIDLDDEILKLSYKEVIL